MAIPSLLEVLARASSDWRAEAACRDTDDPDAWFVVGNANDREVLTSARAAMAYFTCGLCPVRRQCLTEALTVWSVPIHFGPYSTGPYDTVRTLIRAEGIWGGTSMANRHAVRDLPIDDAIERLESELPERMQRRIEGFEAMHPPGPHRYCRQGRCAKARKLLDRLRAL